MNLSENNLPVNTNATMTTTTTSAKDVLKWAKIITAPGGPIMVISTGKVVPKAVTTGPMAIDHIGTSRNEKSITSAPKILMVMKIVTTTSTTAATTIATITRAATMITTMVTTMRRPRVNSMVQIAFVKTMAFVLPKKPFSI